MISETLKLALERFDAADAASSEWRQLATKDLRFTADEQWDLGPRQDRESTGRPCFTADRIAPAIRQIVNESRQNRPMIEVDPTGDGADIDTAHVFAGLIRNIEYQSNADAAYDAAEEYAIKTGLGYFRLISEYCDPETFDQSLVIKAIADPLTVYLDPAHLEPDGSDAEFGFIVKVMLKDDYKRLYPGSELSKLSSWRGRDLNYNGWISRESVRVAEYFYKEYTKHTIYHIAIFVENAKQELQFFQEQVTDEKPSKEDLDSKRVLILNQRTSEKVSIKWDVLNGHEVISSTDFPGEHIPIFPVKGEEFWVDGKRITMGAVRRAQDTQKIINYMISNQVEAIDLANKVPYVGAAGQFDSFEERWRTANQKNYAYLEYNQVDVDGKPAERPTRQTADTPIQAIATTRLQSDDDMKQIMGIYESAQGAQGNETSGVAIIARKEQSSNSNFHYYDNLVRAIKHLGKVLVNAIPTYYDTARSVRIIKPNGEQEMVAINAILPNEKGNKYDLSIGKYDVVVKTGPSYMTKRQKMAESSVALMAAYPAAGPLIADLVVAASDFEGAQEIAARLRTQVPPEVLSATGENDKITGNPKQQIASLQTQLAQSQKNLQAINTHAEQIEQQFKLVVEEKKLLQEKADIEILKANGDYNIKSRQIDLDEQIAELEFLIKQRELQQNERKLDLEEKKVAVGAIGAASKLSDSMHDRDIIHIDQKQNEAAGGAESLTPGGTNPEFSSVSGTDGVDLGGKIGVDTL